MKILMLPTYFGGISWWRFEVPARALAARGHEVYCPNGDQLDDHLRRAGSWKNWLLGEVGKYDLLHVGYNPEPDFAISLFEVRDRLRVPIITDLDDALHAVPTYNGGYAAFHPGSRGSRVVQAQMAHSDALTFSTDPLAAHFGPKFQIPHAVLGNWIDPQDWTFPTPPERAEDRSVRLMVTGGNGRFGDWEIFKEPLQALMAKYNGEDGKPMLRLFFIGATPDWVGEWLQSKDDPKANRAFYIQPTERVREFNKAVQFIRPDIIASPTVHNEFNRCKSGLKYLEAAMAGAAFVCSDFDTYNIAPKDACIRLDNTQTQWTEGLSALIEDEALRLRLASKAAAHVLDACTIGAHIQEREDFYQQVLAGRAPSASDSERMVGGAPTDAEPVRR